MAATSAGPLAGLCAFCDASVSCTMTSLCGVALSQCPAPTLTGMSPTSGIAAGGATVNIYGSDFGSSLAHVSAVSVGTEHTRNTA